MHRIKTLSIYTLMFILSIFIIESCSKKKGCTDAKATNYDSSAKEDDGSCKYAVDRREALIGNYNCTDSVDYNPGTLTDTVIAQIVPVAKHPSDTSKIMVTLDGSAYDAPLAGNSFQFEVDAGSGHNYFVFGQFESGNKIFMQYAFDIADHKIHGTK